MAFRIWILSLAAPAIAAPVAAQLTLPSPGLPPVGEVLGDVQQPVDRLTERTTRQIERLAQERLRTINRLVRRNRDTIALDAQGTPARRGELLVLDADVKSLAAATTSGFALIETEPIEGLDMSVTRLRIPANLSLAEAEELLGTLMPDAEISADNLHFTASAASPAAIALSWQSSNTRPINTLVGMIDGAPGPRQTVSNVRGFAAGAPRPSDHGSAVASLLAHTGVRNILAADVYGTDNAGGNALAIAKALGWMSASGAKVVTISLVGPKNAVLSRAVARAQAKGVVIVAAVGNDGPAAPPAYPASYRGVVAVTGVDRRKRVLIEAGKALHLDYAAPGADIYAANARGRLKKQRGTSFATPLVAGRIAAARAGSSIWRRIVDAEAVDLGKKGPDPTYGRGLLCGNCRGR